MNKKIKLVVSVVLNGNYFLRQDGKMVCGFYDIENLNLFITAYKNKLDLLSVNYEEFYTGFNHHSESNCKLNKNET